jgi:hypothetical protein
MEVEVYTKIHCCNARNYYTRTLLITKSELDRRGSLQSWLKRWGNSRYVTNYVREVGDVQGVRNWPKIVETLLGNYSRLF